MTLIDKAEAHDDLIRRGDALAAIEAWFAETKSFAPPSLQAAIAALPARGVGVPESLRKFLRHDGLCGIVGGYGYCTCGLDAALAPKDADRRPVWPDFIAPPKYENPDPRWIDPALPDFRLIWKVARECGYAVGLHGSMKRDCDLIAVPWTDEAVLAFDLIDHLCTALNAKVVGPVAGKPHGRLGWNLQVDGYVKVIDISVVPRSQDRTAPDLKHIGTGLYETQSDYRLAPHLQRIVEAAKTAPQWDTVNDRMAPQPAPDAHVNETPKSEQDAGNVLTEAAQAREADPALYAQAPERIAIRYDGYERSIQWGAGWHLPEGREDEVTYRREDTAAQAREAALRADEMLRVAARYIRDHYPDGLIRYDDADCDGACVADDCEAAADALIGEARS